jgi:predicted ATPase
MGLIDWLDHVTREIVPYSLELKQFSKGDMAQMMLSIFEPPDIDFAHWVYDETRGHPFYLMETLKDLLERGAIHPKRGVKGQWAFEVDSEHDLGQAVRVPSTVQAVLRSRLYRLSPNAFSLLVAGAVLEQGITFERLCDIANVKEDLGLPALDELVSGRLLLEVGRPEAASMYTFINDILRAVVYTEAGSARRRLFHRRALNVLEAGKESAAILAHHALTAGLDASAFHYCLVAGQEAQRLSAVSEAIVHFEHARWLVLDASLPEQPSETDLHALYVQLGQAYELAGQPEKTSAVYAELEQIMRKPPGGE